MCVAIFQDIVFCRKSHSAVLRSLQLRKLALSRWSNPNELILHQVMSFNQIRYHWKDPCASFESEEHTNNSAPTHKYAHISQLCKLHHVLVSQVWTRRISLKIQNPPPLGGEECAEELRNYVRFGKFDLIKSMSGMARHLFLDAVAALAPTQ